MEVNKETFLSTAVDKLFFLWNKDNKQMFCFYIGKVQTFGPSLSLPKALDFPITKVNKVAFLYTAVDELSFYFVFCRINP